MNSLPHVDTVKLGSRMFSRKVYIQFVSGSLSISTTWRGPSHRNDLFCTNIPSMLIDSSCRSDYTIGRPGLYLAHVFEQTHGDRRDHGNRLVLNARPSAIRALQCSVPHHLPWVFQETRLRGLAAAQNRSYHNMLCFEAMTRSKGLKGCA
jgi:hypothetical protein